MEAHPDDVSKDNDDLRLTRAVAAGDQVAQRALLERVWRRVEKTCRCLGGTSSESDDFLQLALVEVARSAGAFRGECSLEYWVDRITVQTAAKEIRKNARRRKIADAVWHPGQVIRTADETVALSQARDRLSVLFKTLPAKYRTPVVLHYLYDYEVPEIAEMTETKINTVRGHLRRGIRKLRKAVLSDPVLKEWIEKRVS